MISHGNIWAMIFAQVINTQEEEKLTKVSDIIPSTHAFGLTVYTKPPPPVAPPVWMLFLPFYHTFGLHLSCFRQFFIPRTYVVVPRWDPLLVLKSIPQYGVQVLPLIPSAIHQMVNHPLFTKIDLTTLVSVSSGAAYLPPELTKKFMRIVKNASTMVEGYGMSEQVRPFLFPLCAAH